MPSFAAPAWLIGLAFIPLIWWLHRLGNPDEATPVSAAFLFRGRSDETQSSHALPPANPLWILRAAFFSLLVLAMAGLNWPYDEDRHVTVWIDDSLSMQARENGKTRAEIAARALGAELDRADPDGVRIRALSDHRDSFDVPDSSGESRIAAIAGWLDSNEPGPFRIPLALSRDTEHWLVSDGADSGINSWMDDAVVSRLVAVGSETENVAVTGLMARRSLHRDAMHHGSVRVQNLGAADGNRTLEVVADGEVLFSERLEIPPGDSIHRGFRVPVDASGMTARLLPGDALIPDDELEVSLDGLQPVHVDFDDRCGPHFEGALKSNPGLALNTGTDRGTALTVQCSPSPDSPPGPSIAVRTSVNYHAVRGPVEWHRRAAGMTGLPVDSSWLRMNTSGAPPLSERTLLSAPEQELSLIDGHGDSIEIYLDIESGLLVEQSGYPLLVNALAEFVLKRPVLDPVTRVTREPAESRIARQPQSASITEPVTVMRAGTDLAPYLLALAGLLLLADIFLCLPLAFRGSRFKRGSS